MRLRLLKLKVSYMAILKILIRPVYGFVALLAGVLVLGILIWIFNINLLLYIFGGSLPLLEKFAFFFNGYAGVFTNFDTAGAATLLVFAVLIGVNISAATFVARSNYAKAKASRAGTVSLAAAIIGSGCAACGTGILGPLLGAFGATGSIALAKAVGVAANSLGILFVLYGLYGVGKQAATIQANQRQ